MVRLAEMIYTEEEYKKLKEEYDNFKKKVSDDMKEISKYQLDNMALFDKLEEENRRLSEKNKIYSNALVQEKEENRKQKLHIEAKDKAYTALLKDYEELKEKNKNLKEKLEKQLGEMLFDVRS